MYEHITVVFDNVEGKILKKLTSIYKNTAKYVFVL